MSGLLRRRTRRRSRLPHGRGKANNEKYKLHRTFSVGSMNNHKNFGVGSRGVTPCVFSFCSFSFARAKENEQTKIRFKADTKN